ncbi:MAG: hypothetical protein WCQ20_11625 [Synechococcaceae cyanobacterium ELA739]|jgi:hypothetical protein
MNCYRILREDGVNDAIAGQVYASYDEAYIVLERYYADFCCSDERESYRIEEEEAVAPR